MDVFGGRISVSRPSEVVGEALRGVRVVFPYLRARATGRPVPLDVAVFPTYRCNLECRYCDRHQSDRRAELSARQIKSILAGFLEMGTRGVRFDGGEPLLRPDMEPVAAWLAQRGVTVRLNTNGTLLAGRRSWLPHLSHVKISIDGPKEIHDAMRGPGTFDRAMTGVDAALEHGVETELTCVLHKENVRCIGGRPEPLERLLGMAHRLGVKVYFQPARSSLFVSGGSNARLGFQASLRQLRRALRYLVRMAGHPAMGNRVAGLRHFLRFPEHTRVPCSAGWISCSVTPYGTLVPCPMIPPGRGGPDLGKMSVAEAFAGLRRRGCGQCWCARHVELNFAWGGRFWKFL